jgi:hypothetical protein
MKRILRRVLMWLLFFTILSWFWMLWRWYTPGLLLLPLLTLAMGISVYRACRHRDLMELEDLGRVWGCLLLCGMMLLRVQWIPQMLGATSSLEVTNVCVQGGYWLLAGLLVVFIFARCPGSEEVVEWLERRRP